MTDSTAARGGCGAEGAEHPELVAVTRAPSDYSRPTDIHAAVGAALRSLDLPTDFIRPGERVVLKPNWVKEHDERRPGPGRLGARCHAPGRHRGRGPMGGGEPGEAADPS